MTPDLIGKFIDNEQLSDTAVKIEFKKRNAVMGQFVKVTDYEELKSKNFWRIVPEANMEKWSKSRDINLVRIFNGTEFTRLSVVKSKVAAVKP
ncbi:MAG: short-chain dehydrogenase [Chitinophagaceae bacterium]